MKTRIEQGSDHVTITCSKAVAQAIGSAVVSVNEGPFDDIDEDSQFIWQVGLALERSENFEQEESLDASSQE